MSTAIDIADLKARLSEFAGLAESGEEVRLILVTRNVGSFGRIEGLRVENWFSAS